MCGITGIVGGNIRPLKHALKHRGTDGDGEQFRDMVAFGHNRLSVIDLSHEGAQPISNERYMLTYNGEIYNYKDFYSGNKNDAYALLESIELRGVAETLKIINGMFAFGVYDRKTKLIWLAVDRFAQKPLYYTKQGSVFAFASAPSALLHLKDKWNINKEAVKSYFKLGSTMGSQYIWDGIYRMEAGTYATYSTITGKLEVKRYWEPQFIENATIEGCQELVIDAIDKVKVADVPIHIFLSGGIDSTLVASRFRGGHAIHLESNETQYAKQVAEKFDITLNTIHPSEVETHKCLIDYALKCGEPSAAGIIPYITAGEVKKHAKVAVTANGADELFFGYDRTQQDITAGQLAHIFRTGIDYNSVKDIPEIDPRLSKGRWLELMTYVQYDLNKTLDFASMAHTVEVRAPFLDHRLVEYALSIPQAEHGRKQILKDLLKKLSFTDEFLNRPKVGFSLHYQPKGLEQLMDEAMAWCVQEGWLPAHNFNVRDRSYLRYAAVSFHWWYKTFKSIIE